MVSRRRLLVGSAAALGSFGLGVAGTSAWAAASPNGQAALIGGGLPLPDGTTCPVDYLTRAAWGADESIRTWVPEYFPPQTLTVHHTATATNPSDPAAIVRAIYRNQALPPPDGQDFGDIGYHLMIDQFGVVYEGRYSGTDGIPIFSGPGSSPLMVTAAHAVGWNSGNIGVCLIGNFNTGDLPTTAALRALVRVLAGLARVCHIDPDAQVTYVNPVTSATKTVFGVSGHRDWDPGTECPGGTFYPMLATIRGQVAALLRELPTGTTPTPGATGQPAPTLVPPQPTRIPVAPSSGGEQLLPAGDSPSLP